jgi:polyisoprenoid-binding protein YceI
MKSLVVLLSLLATASTMSFTAKDQTYKIDTEKSKLTWLGKKVTGQHTGGINLAEGNLIVKSKRVTGGSFVIDMTSITDVDKSERLVSHLKSDDFFSTEKNPKASFVITSITGDKEQYMVKGNLSIKGITNQVEFPATIQMNGKQITAKAKILVDRTKFDIKFRSGNFFENLGDKVIEDNFELNVELVANQGA